MTAITKEQVDLAKEYLATLEKIAALGGIASLPSPVATAQATVEEPEPELPPPIPKPARRAVPRKDQWTLREEDIEPGIIAWFDSDTLNTDRHVTKPRIFDGFISSQGKFKSGRPCICIDVDGDESAWVSLSTQLKPNQLKLNPEWLQPRDALNGRTSYVTGYVYRGPNESFLIAAAQVEYAYTGVRRPKLRVVGLEAIQEFCENGGTR
jgi:hypothetical protein